MGLSSGFNLPPGVFESDLPGNRPEDQEAQRFAENLTEDDLLAYVEEELVGDLIREYEITRTWSWWTVETTGSLTAFEEGAWIAFATKYDAVAFLLFERWDWIEEKLIERHFEEMADQGNEPDEPDYDSMPGGADDH